MVVLHEHRQRRWKGAIYLLDLTDQLPALCFALLLYFSRVYSDSLPHSLNSTVGLFKYVPEFFSFFRLYATVSWFQHTCRVSAGKNETVSLNAERQISLPNTKTGLALFDSGKESWQVSVLRARLS
jgi:hypothetical protein